MLATSVGSAIGLGAARRAGDRRSPPWRAVRRQGAPSASCRDPGPGRVLPFRPLKYDVRVELLFWEGCPSYPEARQLLGDVLAERGIEAEVQMREVKTDEEAQALRFPGSPTIRIEGRDVDPAGAGARAALSCRIYRLPDGRVSPIPSRQQLEAALQ